MVLDAVQGIRAAGWFQTWPGSTEELAATLQHAWRHHHDDEFELVDEPLQLDQAILAMDDARSTFEIARPGVDEHSDTYRDLVPLLGRLAGLRITRVSEEWNQEVTEAVIAFSLASKRHALKVFECSRYIDPRLIVELNRLIPTEGRRLWFPDQDPIDEMFVVTAATQAERDELYKHRSIRLIAQPSEWWDSIVEE